MNYINITYACSKVYLLAYPVYTILKCKFKFNVTTCIKFLFEFSEYFVEIDLAPANISDIQSTISSESNITKTSIPCDGT